MDTTRQKNERAMWKGLGDAYTAISYLLCGMAVWGGAGWLLDRTLHTAPVLFVVGMVMGHVGGVYLVYLHSQRGESEQRRAT